MARGGRGVGSRPRRAADAGRDPGALPIAPRRLQGAPRARDRPTTSNGRRPGSPTARGRRWSQVHCPQESPDHRAIAFCTRRPRHWLHTPEQGASHEERSSPALSIGTLMVLAAPESPTPRAGRDREGQVLSRELVEDKIKADNGRIETEFGGRPEPGRPEVERRSHRQRHGRCPPGDHEQHERFVPACAGSSETRARYHDRVTGLRGTYRPARPARPPHPSTLLRPAVCPSPRPRWPGEKSFGAPAFHTPRPHFPSTTERSGFGRSAGRVRGAVKGRGPKQTGEFSEMQPMFRGAGVALTTAAASVSLVGDREQPGNHGDRSAPTRCWLRPQGESRSGLLDRCHHDDRKLKRAVKVPQEPSKRHRPVNLGLTGFDLPLPPARASMGKATGPPRDGHVQDDRGEARSAEISIPDTLIVPPGVLGRQHSDREHQSDLPSRHTNLVGNTMQDVETRDRDDVGEGSTTPTYSRARTRFRRCRRAALRPGRSTSSFPAEPATFTAVAIPR